MAHGGVYWKQKTPENKKDKGDTENAGNHSQRISDPDRGHPRCRGRQPEECRRRRAALAGRPGHLEAPCTHPVPVDGQAAWRHLYVPRAKHTRAVSTALPGIWSTPCCGPKGDTIQLELRADDAIKAERFPYDFVLTSTFRLDGKTVHHTLQVTNPGTEELRFGIGYPPGVQYAVRCQAHHHRLRVPF